MHGAFHKGLFYACFSVERHEKELEEGDVSNHLEKILSNTHRNSVYGIIYDDSYGDVIALYKS